MRKSIPLLVLACALFGTAALADSSRAIVGGTLGGAAGAAIGYNVNGRDGAIVGAALGGALGVAAASNRNGYHYERREVIVERPTYYYPPVRTVYYAPRPPERIIYVEPRWRDHGWHRGWDHGRHHDHDGWGDRRHGEHHSRWD